MLILLVSTVLLSGCGKIFLSRLFKSEHEEYAEILTAFLAAANQNDTKKIEKLFAPNIRGKEFQKEWMFFGILQQNSKRWDMG